MVKITFLGTGDAVPTAERNHTSILLTHKGENILIDCGEGTQRQLRKAEINPCKITRILISHLHGDHTLGLVGLLQTFSMSGYNKTLYIYGPKGTKKFIQKLLEVFSLSPKTKSPQTKSVNYPPENPQNYEIKTQEVTGKFLEEQDFYIEAKPMTHGTPCNAYSFVEKGQLKIDKEKLKKSKIPESPQLKELKEGKDIILEGKKYSSKNLTFKEKDKKISFILDTSFNSGIAPFVKNSDLMISESSFADDLKDKAKEYKHLTAKQVSETAKKSKVKKLILIHISQRYDKNKEIIQNEAEKSFKNTIIAKDLDVFEV